ncbi:MAG: BMP family ABC transporter substrate-binding protein [Enterocloster citroniae]|nr:BMP family ABC transporter substrate-binding protein [Enterocloster citroniae]MCC3394443.1 BMP family ABC transporter substrate-binding protein [Clostridiales bacterium AHG0011]
MRREGSIMRVKKLAAVTLCVALGLSTVLAGCGKTAQTAESGTAAAGQTDAGPDASAKTPETGGAAKESKAGEGKSDEKKVIGLLIPSPVGDPFIALCVKGLQRLADEEGAELKIVETLDKAEYEDQVRAMADMGYNPVYTMWGDLSEIALRLAPEYKDTDFVLCDVYMETNEPNVSSVSVDPSESSFIAGVVAANNTEKKKVGFIAHADRPVSRKYRDGFIHGVHYVDPSIQVSVAYVGNDQDPVKGQEVAKLMIQNEGVDLIFQSASRSGLGVIAGCDELNVKCIGSDDYQGDVGKSVIWSALKPIDEALYREGKASFDGTFEGGDKEYGLAQDLPMYTQQEFDKLTPELQETVEKVTQDIKAGTIDVTKDTAN